ncbi:Embryogenesis transmembrane protein-like [Zea mays]|uniref:Embryogenesis transmembrane protein-like n=3 Tax=Zea mays TaxID=4577 RepID=A0A1D6QHG9_MAIZE|nr:Embryogenesis transmembrane protein-like [Zea mays]
MPQYPELVLDDLPAAPPPPPAGMVTTARDAYFLWELRKYVLLQATLAASVTYSAGLSPPGGVWPDNNDSTSSANPRLAGDPVLQVTYARRYGVFFYSNATAFVASVVTINLLLMQSLSRHRGWLRALQAVMILNQLGLMAAYAAGSCRELAMSAYVVALVAMVALYVCAHVLLFALCALRRRGAVAADDAAAPAQAPPDEEPGAVERSRKYLLIFATLVATVTYQAGLSTPGGFLSNSQDDGDHLAVAGDPVLPGRFMGFFYFNTTAFVASLVVIMLLMSRTVTRHGLRSCALWVCTGAALVGLVGAFAVGSSRSLKTSVYVVALVVAVLSYIGLQVLVFFCKPVETWVHNVQGTLQRYLKLESSSSQDPRARLRAVQETAEADQLLRKSRMYLLLLGILAASVTYQAGLNPPGGFWQARAADGVHHYLPGDPVLHNTYPGRYLAFFYCNATAFVASLVILILLLSNVFSTQGIKYCALQVAMIMDLLGLIGAYAAGSCRQVSKSVYVSVLVIPVFLYVGVHVMVFMLQVFPNIGTWRRTVRDRLEEAVPRCLKKLFELPPEEDDEDMRWKLEKRRKLLLLLAILAASLTYQAGLNPPGGFWQENSTGHVVGNPVLNDNYRRRYMAFFYCNATAFVSSLAIIMLLVNRKLSARGIQSHALGVCVVLDLAGLMGAFAAGSSRKVSTSIYVLVLVVAVLLCITLQVVLVVSESVQRLLQRLLSVFDVTEGDAGFVLPHVAAAASNGEPRDPWYEKKPKYLLLLAALAAAVTYQAAMNPPGGLWDDGHSGHVAGDPVLRSSHPSRYRAFFYCNATSFMASLVIMVLLLMKRVCRAKQAILALHAAMILTLFGLMGAYAAGSCRRVRTSAYILALVIGVSVYIVVLVVVSIGVAKRLKGVVDELAERVVWCFSAEDL